MLNRKWKSDRGEKQTKEYRNQEQTREEKKQKLPITHDPEPTLKGPNRPTLA